MADSLITGGAGLNSVPAPGKQTLQSAFVDLRDAGWAQQYLPELMEKEAEVFGNRTISGFLSQVGAEEAMASDQVIWSEQGRLHIKADLVAVATPGTGECTLADHPFRVGDTVVAHATGGTGVGLTIKGYVSAVPSTSTFNVLPYTSNTLTTAGFDATTEFTMFVYGSEYVKGDTGRGEALEPGFDSFENKPVIIKDLYEVSGSDASAIGWIEVSGEDGQAGYLWYLKASGDTMSRFADYCEMVCIEGELATGTGIQGALGALAGTEGLFAAVKNRGHYTTGILGDSPTNDLEQFDYILKKFDSQGAIEENMMFVNRTVSLAIDDMLAAQNSYGTNGTSYGVFDNSEDMALNLGFSGFRRGSYDFYKSDWKYLNDANTRGALNGEDVRGVFVPAGVSSVYDQMLGKNMKRPFLHVRYRASQTESRRMKTWITGSVGAATSDLDAMQVNYLSERCLITQGANNFMLLTD